MTDLQIPGATCISVNGPGPDLVVTAHRERATRELDPERCMGMNVPVAPPLEPDGRHGFV